MRNFVTYLLIAMTLTSNVFAQYFSKRASQTITSIQTALSLNFFSCIFFYVFSTGCYMLLLRRIPLSTAYPLFSVSFVLVALVGHFAFGETIGSYKVLGILLILTGVFFVAYSDYSLSKPN